MNWIIALIVAIVCLIISNIGMVSKDITIKEWQFWAIIIGETISTVCMVYIVQTLWF